MNGITQIRYSPQADWRQYLAQGFGNLMGGLEQQSQRNLMGGDIQALQQYFAGGRQGQFPNVQTNLAQQLILQSMLQGGTQRQGFTLSPGQTRFGPQGRPIATGALDKSKKFETATVLRKEFNQSKVFKNYQIIQRSERAMKRAYQASIDPKIKSKVASDQALAVLFQKMLDPDSVVRESEYARTPEGVALLNRIQAWLPKLEKGGLAISNEDRAALYDMAKKLLEEGKITLNEHIDRYSQLAQDYSVKPKLILGNIKRFDIETSEKDPLGLGL